MTTMRYARPFLLFIAAALLAAACVQAQDAQKIIDQYLKAVGGNKTVTRIQTLSLDGVFSTATGSNPGAYTLRIKQPNRFYQELNADGKTLIEAYNGKSAW